MWTQRQTCIEERGCEETQGKYQVKVETEIGIMLLQAKGHLGLPGFGIGKGRSSPTGFRGSMVLLTP